MKLELKEIYICRVLRALGLSVITVFVPIYLLNLGYPLNDVLLYLFFEFLFLAVFSPYASYLESKLGIKHTLSLGTLFQVVFLLMLFTIESMGWSLPFLGFMNGFAHALFWIPFNANFVKTADKGKYGREVGILAALPHTMAVIGPLFGALMITYFSFDATVILACVILSLSITPFFLTKDIKPKVRRIENLFHRRNWNYFDLYVVKGFLSVVMLIWPIFVFYIVGDYVTIGIIEALKGFGAAIFTFIVGIICDKIKLGHVFKIAGILNVIIWVTVFLTSSSPPIFILSFLIGLVYIFVSIPTFVLSTMVSQKTPTEFMVFREIALCTGRCSLLALMIFLPFENKFTIPFILAAIVSVYLIIFRTRRVKF